MKPNKLLGQNFLTSKAIARKIVAAASISPKDTVLEIGPGRGSLTEFLVEQGGSVIALEKDPNLVTFLQTKFQNSENIQIVQGDILKTATHELGLTHYKIVANLPYYITSHFLRIMLEQQISKPELMVLMVQKEVADRIVAKPREMSLLALSVQAYGNVKKLFTVSKNNFLPVPQVDSSVIRIEKISKEFFETHNIDSELFFSFIRKAFAQKRKMLRNSLEIQGGFGNCRPQELNLEQWRTLYLTFGKIVMSKLDSRRYV